MHTSSFALKPQLAGILLSTSLPEANVLLPSSLLMLVFYLLLTSPQSQFVSTNGTTSYFLLSRTNLGHCVFSLQLARWLTLAMLTLACIIVNNIRCYRRRCVLYVNVRSPPMFSPSGLRTKTANPSKSWRCLLIGWLKRVKLAS